VRVRRRLRVAVISTGSELLEPGDSLPGPGQLYNSNRPMLLSLLQRLGCEIQDMGNVADDAGATRAALKRAAESADLVLSSGGVSVGEADHVRAAVETLGSLDLWKIAVKPGKPFAYGRIASCPFIGLPGNPASAFVTFLLLARPWIRARQGCRDDRCLRFQARADFERDGSATREEYLRVRLDESPAEDGVMGFALREATSADRPAVWATPFSNQSSGILRSIVAADALARVRAGQTVQRGDTVEVLPLDLLLT
jgi:molybdopterin molybdotransferase